MTNCEHCRDRFCCWTRELNNTVKFEGDEFYGIKELDLYRGTISFLTTKEGGSYLTGIPISPFNYRKKHPTKYSLTWKDGKGCACIFIVRDDWGRLTTIEIKETKENEPFVAKNKRYAKLLAEGKLI